MNKTARRFSLLWLIGASMCLAQEQAPEQLAAPPPAQTTASQDAAPRQQNTEITVLSGTRIALSLTNAIRSQFAHRGDPVRAVTAFPVAVGDQVAIPSGTYVDGTIEKVTKRGASGHGELEIHFTGMVFASGYAVSLDTAGTLARALPCVAPGARLPADSVSAAVDVPDAFSFQQPPPPTPTLTPPPNLTPKYATVFGVIAGATVTLMVTALALRHRHSGDILFEAGSQFEMVLTSPLSLDTSRVSVAVPAAQ
jgi:hypothetical protein